MEKGKKWKKKDGNDKIDLSVIPEHNRGTNPMDNNSMEVNKCPYCGVKDICRISITERQNCKLKFGYHPVNIMTLHQLRSLIKTDRNWKQFLQQIDKRDINYWNSIVPSENEVTEN